MSDIIFSTDDLMLSSPSSINTSLPSYVLCFLSETSALFISLFTMNIIVLLPLCIFILHHGIQDWKRRRSSFSATSMSHIDCFTYNMVVMELICVFGYFLCSCGIYKKDSYVIGFGLFPITSNYYGQSFFHVLTCIERYLAVMHPVIYMRLKQERGVRVRNVLICCVWLISLGLVYFAIVYDAGLVSGFCVLMLIVLVTSFCSLSVLCALIRPGPGKKTGERKKVDPKKYRAFYTIVVILITLTLRLVTGLIWAGNYITGYEDCILLSLDYMFYLPSSLILPSLLLHREGKFKVCLKVLFCFE